MRLQKHTCSLAHQGGGSGSNSGTVPVAASKKKYAFKRLSKVKVVQTGGKVFKGDMGVIAGFYHDASSSVPSYYLYRIRDNKLIGGVKENVLREQVGGDDAELVFQEILRETSNNDADLWVNNIIQQVGTMKTNLDPAGKEEIKDYLLTRRNFKYLTGDKFFIKLNDGTWSTVSYTLAENGPHVPDAATDGKRYLCYTFLESHPEDGTTPMKLPLHCILPDLFSARDGEAEAKRQASETEAKRQASEAEAKRQASEAEAKRQADEAEAKRQAGETEAKKQADEAEAKRQAEAERQREEEAKRQAEAKKQEAAEAEAALVVLEKQMEELKKKKEAAEKEAADALLVTKPKPEMQQQSADESQQQLVLTQIEELRAKLLTEDITLDQEKALLTQLGQLESARVQKQPPPPYTKLTVKPPPPSTTAKPTPPPPSPAKPSPPQSLDSGEIKMKIEELRAKLLTEDITLDEEKAYLSQLGQLEKSLRR